MRSNHARIREYLAEHPGTGVREAARQLGVSHSSVSRAGRVNPPVPDLPEPWVLVSLHADMLRQLEDRAVGAQPGRAAGRRPHQWPLDDLLAAVDGYLDEIIDGSAAQYDRGLLRDVARKARRAGAVPEPEPAKKRTVQVRGNLRTQHEDADADRLSRGESVPGGPGACTTCGHLTLWHRAARSYKSYRNQPCQADGCGCTGWKG